jgi:hypothetical protein
MCSNIYATKLISLDLSWNVDRGLMHMGTSDPNNENNISIFFKFWKNHDVASNVSHRWSNFQLDTMCTLGYIKYKKM